MLFLIHWQTEPEHRNASARRFEKIHDGAPEGVRIVGTWHSVTQLEGWCVAEAGDAVQLGNWLHAWTDLNVNHITPVVDNEDVLKIIEG